VVARSEGRRSHGVRVTELLMHGCCHAVTRRRDDCDDEGTQILTA
jgi:hypothetical protein